MLGEMIGEIHVCTDCMVAHTTGESNPHWTQSRPEPWSLLKFGFNATQGGEHSEYCDRDEAGECDCQQLGFCTTACDGCGDRRHGDRYRFTLWRTSAVAARNRFRQCIEYARDWGTDPADRIDRVSWLNQAAEWRRYIAEQKRNAERHVHSDTAVGQQRGSI